MIHQHRILGNLVIIWAVAGLLISSSVHGQTTDDEDSIDCPLCADPTHFPQDPLARFVSGADTWTCESAFDLGNLTLPADNCTFWQSRGEVICQCAEEAPETNECTLCEDGSALPNPLLPATPEETCAEVQVDAKRGEAGVCIVYQQTIGIYCGCDNPQATSAGQEVCRVCGGETNLPDPLIMASLVTDNGDIIEASCVELEFAANLPGADCSDFQILYTEGCCPEEPAPSPAPEDGAPLVASSLFGLSLLMLLAGLFIVQ
jgi:hypothetical protein